MTHFQNSTTTGTRRRNCFLVPLLCSMAMCVGVPAAQSEVLLQTNNSATITPITASSTIIISGATTFSFNIPGSSFVPVMIVFSAECGVGGSATNTLDLDILLDAAGGLTSFNPIAPSSSAFNTPLCSGDGTTSNSDSLMTSSMTVAANLPPGLNRIQIRATPSGGAGGPGRIGARTLVVMR